jgi:hypothetical protein
MKRLFIALNGLVLGILPAVGCQPASTPSRPTVSLRLRGGPASGTVVIDDEMVGTLDFVEARGVALPVGVHRVTIQARGYFPWDREIDAKLGSGPIRVDVAMIEVPD